MTEVVDAEPVPEEEEASAGGSTAAVVVNTAVPEGSSRALVQRPSREVLMPLDVEQVIAGMEAYQAMLPRLLTADDWQGKPGADGSFVKKSGWRKISRAFNLSLEKVSATVERDASGSPIRAESVYRAVAPNGQVSEGDGYCAREESRFAKEKGRQKLENDLRATATTRAKSRAISDLVGMGKVSAEEAQAGGDDAPPFGPLADEATQERMLKALAYLMDQGDGPDEEAALAAFNAIGKDCGYIPKPVARAVLYAAAELKRRIEERDEKVARATEEAPRDEQGRTQGETPAEPEEEVEVVDGEPVEIETADPDDAIGF